MKASLVTVFALSGLLAMTTSIRAQNLQFATACTPAVAANPVYVAVADVNGDGSPDLIAVSNPNILQFRGVLTVLTNNGMGIYGSNATLLVNGNISTVVAADINGDHKPDLACYAANGSGSYLVIFTNNGAGIFASNTTIFLSSTYNYGGVNGGSSQFLAPVDANGDGKTDLVAVVNSTAGLSGTCTLTLFTNNGAGILSSNSAAVFPRLLQYLLVGDFNGDGRPDFMLGGLQDADQAGQIEVLTSGSGTLTPYININSARNSYSVAAGDFNGDGKLDLVSFDATYSFRTLDVYTNAGNAAFQLLANASVTNLNTPTWLTAADLNHDQSPDLATVFSNTNLLIVLTNNGAGAFASNTTVQVGSGPIYVTAADVNGDGKMDLITVNQKDNTLSVLVNISVLPVPPLSIVNLVGQNALIWSAPPGSFVLQTTTNLSSGTWTTVTNGTPLNCIAVPNLPPTAFYRLQFQ